VAETDFQEVTTGPAVPTLAERWQPEGRAFLLGMGEEADLFCGT
jgi:hypothetical protein